MPHLSFAGSAFSKLRNAISGSNYTFNETRPAHLPAPLSLSPTDFAIKSWFDKGEFRNGNVRISVTLASIWLWADRFCKLSDNLSLDLRVVADFVPGEAQVSFVDTAISAGFLVRQDTMSVGTSGKLLRRDELLSRMIDPQAFERWLVHQGYTDKEQLSYKRQS